MSSSSPHLPNPEDAKLSPSDATVPSVSEVRAVKTFAFDVSAGPTHSASEGRGVYEGRDLSERDPQPFISNDSEQEAGKTKISTAPATELAAEPLFASIIIRPEEEAAASNARDRRQSVTRSVTRQAPWWITSFGIHVLLILLLAFSSLTLLPKEELELYASSTVYAPIEELEEFNDIEINFSTEEFPSEIEVLPELLDTPLDEPLVTEIAPLDLNIEPPQDLTEITPVPGELASAGGLLAPLTPLTSLAQSTNTTNTTSPQTSLPLSPPTKNAPATARFFGTEIQARRILYMLDNSGGMLKSGKFEALVSELMASVRALGPKQEFYVVFYSDTVYPLFFPHSVRKFVRSNPRNQKQLEAWLATVELCGGNAIDEALAAAEVIRPDAVFLLTDGNLFTTDNKEALLLNRSGRKYPIHTFGLGVRPTTKTAANLQKVAEANGGTFRAIKVSAADKKNAREKMRVYHKSSPGQVWGRNVGSW